MSLINFKKACRSCNRTDGLSNMIMDMENDVDYYQNLTDLSVAMQIVDYLEDNEIDCEFCGKNNFDVFSINVDDQNIFNLKELKREHSTKGNYFYVYDMTKINNMGEVKHDDNGVRDYDAQQRFEIRCKVELQKLINTFPTQNLVHNENGVFYVCFTGNDTELKIQKLRYSGFTKEALLNLSNRIGKDPFD